MHYFFNCVKNGKSSKTCKHRMVNDKGVLQSTFFLLNTDNEKKICTDCYMDILTLYMLGSFARFL